MPSQSYSLLDIPGPRQTFVHVHPGAEELGRVYHPHLAINAAPTALCRGAGGLAAAERHPLACRDQDRATPTTSPGPTRRRRSPAASTSARSWCGCAKICPTTPSSAAAPAISHPGFIASIASGNSPRTSGRARARWATACRRRSAMKRLLPGAHRRRHLRRRRFPDERAGIRHRRAVRAAVRHARSSTTASTAPSACTRSANIPAASSRPN